MEKSMNKQPWYKRIAIWITIVGAMLVGATILFGKWVRWNLFRTPYEPVQSDREIMDQTIEDEIKTIDIQIEALNEPKAISHDRTIVGVNADLATARELRRVKRDLIERLGNRGADRGNSRED
jgi:hypothetical protein